MDESRILPPNAVDATPSRLIKRVVSNDQSAWLQLVRLYGPIVRFWICGTGLQSQDMADIFQEVFSAVSKKIGDFERQEGDGKFRAWLKTIAKNKVIDHFRGADKNPDAVGGSEQVLRIHQLSEDNESSMEQMQDNERASLLQRALHLVRGEFNEQHWQAFWRIAVDNRTSKEVAEELGMSAAGVRKAKSRVLQRLRQELQEFGDPLIS